MSDISNGTFCILSIQKILKMCFYVTNDQPIRTGGTFQVAKETSVVAFSLCSRNFQNVKLRLDFVEIWSFYCHPTFTWNQILVNSNGTKMSFLAVSVTLNSEFLVNLEFESCSNLLKSKFRISKMAKNDIVSPFEFTKIWFHVNSE